MIFRYNKTHLQNLVVEMDCFIFIFLLSIIPYYTRATICYECLDGASNCTLIETTDTGYLGCLIEFDNEDGNELKVAKVGKFCPDSYPECQSLIIDKHYWLTFIWEMHNPNLLARKIPIKKMWYECLEDKCNNPEYISNLKSVLVEWESSIIDLPSRSAGPQKNCFDCEKQNVSHDCEVSVSCNSTNELCKTQGYLVDTNPFATRLFLHYNVRFWQSKCETLAENTNLIDYSITGYLINNLNTKEKYCYRSIL